MKIMVVGGGGREHAIIKKLKENKNVTEIYALPGNGGIAEDAICVDIGAKDKEDARKYVQEGDPIHLHTYHAEMLNGYLAARAVDDRGCAFIVLEALKRAKEKGCKIGAYAATTVGEETTGRGAHSAVAKVNPTCATSLDVTYAADINYRENLFNDVYLGKGPALTEGSLMNKVIHKDMINICEDLNIPYQIFYTWHSW